MQIIIFALSLIDKLNSEYVIQKWGREIKILFQSFNIVTHR